MISIEERSKVTKPINLGTRLYLIVFITSIALTLIGFMIFSRMVGSVLPAWYNWLTIAFLVAAPIIVLPSWKLIRSTEITQLLSVAGISLLLIAGILLAMTTAYQMIAYIRLPVDLLSFAESPFLNQILKIRQGLPLFTPPQDNNSYPYTPGAEFLTYFISWFILRSDSIPTFRAVQFSYVILAAILATSASDNLAKRILAKHEYRMRPLWLAIWLSFLFLVATDPRFNLYTHSLHNDGLALLISVLAFWLIVRHSLIPRRWQVVLMAILPALGFLVKQSLMIWLVIFVFYLLFGAKYSWKRLMFFSFGSLICIALVIGGSYLIWGEPFRYWIFEALGQKQISFLRDFKNLFDAGIYAVMGLVGGWVLVNRRDSRVPLVLWICWLLLFGTEIYTSGFAFQRNHIGPGIVIAACWFFVALVKFWAGFTREESRWRLGISETVAISSVILVFGALGLVREPINPIPADFYRYIDSIEAEFNDLAPEKVLMDTGTWIYFSENVLMKDRSAPISVHVGSNQPDISFEMLSDSISRIENKTYDKILARQLDTGETWYDYQDRGSGVKEAILENYHIVRRIPAVQGIQNWWPVHLIEEILVLEPNS